MGNDVAARLELLETRFTLLDLVASYSHGFDGHDLERLRSIWFEDSVLDLGAEFGRADGLAEIVEIAEGFWSQIPFMHHWMANTLLDIDLDDGSADGLSALDCHITRTTGEAAWLGGTYRDRFVRRDGRRGLLERRFDLAYQTPVDSWAPELGSEAPGGVP